MVGRICGTGEFKIWNGRERKCTDSEQMVMESQGGNSPGSPGRMDVKLVYYVWCVCSQTAVLMYVNIPCCHLNGHASCQLFPASDRNEY